MFRLIALAGFVVSAGNGLWFAAGIWLSALVVAEVVSFREYLDRCAEEDELDRRKRDAHRARVRELDRLTRKG